MSLVSENEFVTTMQVHIITDETKAQAFVRDQRPIYQFHWVYIEKM